jgi:hypothetical protein
LLHQQRSLPTTSALPQVPGYEVLEELGRGGMGVVFKARQVGLNRVVALKVILAGQLASADQRARFLREAEAVARLHHPNSVEIHELGEHQGQPFFALEYLPGGTLADKFEDRPQPPRYAAELVETLARAVQHAHEQGIVHRDLKPGNVLLAADGTPKITDFGLAKTLDEDESLTESGAVVGTPSYMAPEQAGGKSKDQPVGPPADVYALGALLYQALTGRPPFEGTDRLETLLLVLSTEPAPPRRLQPKLPRDLETICLKCLSKEPSKRYACAADLADDLRRFLDGRPIAARPTPRWERLWKWSKRRPTMAAGLAGAVVLLLAGLAGGWWYWDTYLRTRVAYYAVYTNRWGVPQGLVSVRADEVRQHHQTFKFYSRARRLLKVEVVNGHDQPTARHDIGTHIEGIGPQEQQRRECSYEFHYNEGRVAKEVARNRAGRVVWTLHYTSATTAHFTDERGSIRPGRGSEAAYVEFVWNAEGLLQEELYRDSQGNPAPAPSGVHGRRFVYDERGFLVKTISLDADGKPTCARDGFATTEFRYDERGNLLDRSYFGVDGRPTLHKDSYARLEKRYDEHGNCIEQTYLDGVGKPTLHRVYGFARLKATFDAHGRKTEQATFGIDGKPLASRVEGVPKVTWTYDQRGNPIKVAFWGADGKPALHKEGYARFTTRYDERGNRVEWASFGLDGKPIQIAQGYARWQARYDERGQHIDIAYFDQSARPLRAELLVTQVLPGSQGQRVGLRVGDVLLSYDGQAVVNWPRFSAAVRQRAGGEKRPVALRVRRQGKELHFSLAPGPLGVLLQERVVRK